MSTSSKDITPYMSLKTTYMEGYRQLPHEDQAFVHSLREALERQVFPERGEKIIWKQPFRWHDEDGVLANHREGCSVEYLAETFGYEIVVNLNYAAIVKPI